MGDSMEVQASDGIMRRIRIPRRVALSERFAAASLYLASIVMFLLLWEFVAEVLYRSPLFPGPIVTARTFARLAVGELPNDVGISLLRVLSGFALGAVVGTVLGLAMGTYKPVRSLFEPYVHFLRFIPPIAWFTPAVIWFGIGEESKIFLIVYTTTFVIILNTIAGVEALPEKRVLVARMFGASQIQIFRRITLPSALPYILTGLRLASGNSFMTLVAAEMLGANHGVGFLIMNARLWAATDQVFCGMFVLGCMGYGTDLVIRFAIAKWAWRYMPQGQSH